LDPAIHIVEIRPATPQGYHRSFCLKIEIGRGSPENPGLVAGLREGGQCQGLLFRVPASAVDRGTDVMWIRGVVFYGYVPAVLHLETNLGRWKPEHLLPTGLPAGGLISTRKPRRE